MRTTIGIFAAALLASACTTSLYNGPRRSSSKLAYLRGVCVPGARSSTFFREVLPRLGLLPHETEDFVAAWAPRMEGAAFHVIGFHPREEEDALAPVEVSPPPEHMIRLLRDATPVKTCPTGLTPSVLPDVPPAREGFTVVIRSGCTP